MNALEDAELFHWDVDNWIGGHEWIKVKLDPATPCRKMPRSLLHDSGFPEDLSDYHAKTWPSCHHGPDTERVLLHVRAKHGSTPEVLFCVTEEPSDVAVMSGREGCWQEIVRDGHPVAPVAKRHRTAAELEAEAAQRRRDEERQKEEEEKAKQERKKGKKHGQNPPPPPPPSAGSAARAA